jgi:hypothetical protein
VSADERAYQGRASVNCPEDLLGPTGEPGRTAEGVRVEQLACVRGRAENDRYANSETTLMFPVVFYSCGLAKFRTPDRSGCRLGSQSTHLAKLDESSIRFSSSFQGGVPRI